MKTKILKPDIALQIILIALNAAFLPSLFKDIFKGLPLNFYTWLGLFYVQIIVAVFQYIGNAVHLMLNHKSIGFYRYRMLYFFAVPVYVLVADLIYIFPNVADVLITNVLVTVPLIVSMTYLLLSIRELKYLNRREFFILH